MRRQRHLSESLFTEEVQLTMRKIVSQAAGTYYGYGHRNELEGIAHDVFMDCVERWAPAHGAFLNYFSRSLFLKLIPQPARQVPFTSLTWEHDTTDHEYVTNIVSEDVLWGTRLPQLEDDSFRDDLLAELGQDARYVVEVLLDEPPACLHALGGVPRKMKTALIRWLGDEWGWSRRRIYAAFEDIKTKIAHV